MPVKDKVVYLLGAGFSAPLGLPVMSNFRMKSEDMFAADPRAYPHFENVFKTIKELSIIKNYYEANLFNIEEILSILEMGEHLEGKRLSKDFIKYIVDVIAHYTPSIKLYEDGKVPGNWHYWLFGEERIWHAYGLFVGNLFNLQVRSIDKFGGNYEDLIATPDQNAGTQYSIVTLNYDKVPEQVASFINDNYETKGERIEFNDATPGTLGAQMARDMPRLAKLHGSVDSGVVVPPTWSKGNTPKIIPTWKLAYQLLSDATHLRIIGYSLPVADAYVKYLLKAATTDNPRLKRVDVICLDPHGDAKGRYDAFIKFDYYKFINASVIDYLKVLMKHYSQKVQGSSLQKEVALNQLETAHAEFVQST